MEASHYYVMGNLECACKRWTSLCNSLGGALLTFRHCVMLFAALLPSVPFPIGITPADLDTPTACPTTTSSSSTSTADPFSRQQQQQQQQ
jgi:hypothetical protein